MLLYGKILLHENNFKKAHKMIRRSARKKNSEAEYEYGKMLFCGQGCTANEEKAMKYFHLSKESGFKKSKQFLMIYQKIIEDQYFIQIEKEIQLFIILQIIENFTYRCFFTRI